MSASKEEIEAVKAGGSPIQVLIMSFLVSAEGVNLWAECYENLVLEPNANYQKEYQGWCRIRLIGQTEIQKTTRLVNRQTLDAKLEEAMVWNAEPIAYAMQAVDRGLSESLQSQGLGGDRQQSNLSILDVLIGRISDKEKARNGMEYTVLGDEAHDPVNDPEVPEVIPNNPPPPNTRVYYHREDLQDYAEDDEERWDL